MKKIILLLSLLPLYSIANDDAHLKLLNGDWNCPDSNDIAGKVSTKTKHKYSFDSSKLIYEYHGVVEYTYEENIPIGVLDITEKGSFSYSLAKLTYMPKNSKVEVIDDEFEAFSADVINNMEKELAEGIAEERITKINESEWERLSDNNKFVCFRDIAN